jgi:hypothetical protein
MRKRGQKHSKCGMSQYLEAVVRQDDWITTSVRASIHPSFQLTSRETSFYLSSFCCCDYDYDYDFMFAFSSSAENLQVACVTVSQSHRIWPRFSKSRIRSTYTLQRTYFLHLNKMTLRPLQRAFPIEIVNLLRQEIFPCVRIIIKIRPVFPWSLNNLFTLWNRTQMFGLIKQAHFLA